MASVAVMAAALPSSAARNASAVETQVRMISATIAAASAAAIVAPT